VRTLRVIGIGWAAGLLVLWVACTVLHVKQVSRGQLAWVGVYVAPPTGGDDVPTVRGFWPGAPDAASGGLRVGDRVLRVGDADLHGVGPFGFVARTYAAAAVRGDLRVPLAYERLSSPGHTTITLVPVAYPWRMLPLTCTSVITAALVLARLRGAPVARSFFLLAIAYGLHWTFFFGGPVWQTYAWVVVFLCASLVMLPLILRVALIWPAEVGPAGGRLPWWPWLFAVFAPISSSWVFGVPLPPETGLRGAFAVNVAFIVTLLVVLTRNFARAGPLGRRQLKWVVLGMYLGTVPVLLADVVAAVAPPLWRLHDLAAIAEIVIPLSIVIAIVDANLFDVDRLITVTAVYSVLSVLPVGAALFAVPELTDVVSTVVRLDPSIVQPLLSVGVAAGIIPGQRFLQPRIERLLFRERHALRAGIEGLLRELAGTTGPDELFTLVGERLDALVRPQSCLIYAPLGACFAPVFAQSNRGHDAPPSVPTDSAVIAALRARSGPLDVRQWARARTLAPAERSVLEALGASTAIPVRRDQELAAAIFLGPKRSGDVYTPTDLALLAAVADKVSGELLRFDAAVILRQEREMSDGLRRYVPEPVAVRLARGQPIEGGEHEVSVLFVDIWGYTAYSERQAAGTVFSMINRYTEAVSAVIQRRGGTVVEFLGDGLMAVFGAPEDMPQHAREAVQAACEVVATVRSLALGSREGAAPIAAGVGIASGQAFVGNVRTNDRLVYTAVGDIVNLASRLERLTRELHAAVAIDARTHSTAGDAAAAFRRHEHVLIRGRAEPVDVYALPLAGS
jgi:class 3 adenylate cyclase